MRTALIMAMALQIGCTLLIDPGENLDPATFCKGAPNGVVDDGEECDDGNDSNTDACTTGCKLAACGDGFVREFLESCDGTPDCSEQCVSCDVDANAAVMVGNRCYSLHLAEEDWDPARSTCFSVDADLATFAEATDAEVVSALESEAGSLPEELWLGLAPRSGTWQWIAGDPGPSAPNWANGQPTTDGGARGIVETADPAWGAYDTSVRHPSLCMRASTRGIADPRTGHVYLLEHTSFGFGSGTFDEALRACDERGAHLATINSSDEFDFIRSTFGNGTIRVGYDDRSGTGRWITGETFDPSLFGTIPDFETDGGCGQLRNGQLGSALCANGDLDYLCEWD